MDAPLPWDDLLVFLAAAREGGASGAARALKIHHATASRRISNLERQLGTRLFERSTQGMAMTAEGEMLLAHALNIESEVDAIRRRIAGRDRRLEGTVTVSTVDDLALSVMPELVRRFRLAHPSVTLEIDLQVTQADLRRREADLAIRFGRPPDDPGVVRRRIATVNGALYASQSYLAGRPAPKSAEELRSHDIIRCGARLKRLPTEQFWDLHGAPDRTALRSDSMLAQFAAVRRGVGIGWLPYFLVEGVEDLCRIPVAAPDVDTGLWMVIHSDVRRTTRVRVFADFAWDYLTAMRNRFENAVGQDVAR